MEQVLVAGYGNALSKTATEYNTISGSISWNATANLRTQLISAPGKIKELRVELSDAPGNQDIEYYDFTLMVDDAPSALTCRIKNAETSGSDVAHEIDVVAGKKVTMQCAPSASAPDNTPFARWSTVFEGTNAKESNILGMSETVSGTTTNYCRVHQSNNSKSTTEADWRQVIPTGGTIKNLYVLMVSDPGDSPDAYTFTLRLDNGGGLGDTALAVTITADDVAGNNVADDVAVSAGDVVTLSHKGTNSPVAALSWFGFTFEATIDGESLILAGTSDNLSSSATEYNQLGSGYYFSTWTAEASRLQLAQECVLKKLHVLLSGSPGAGNNYTFTVRRSSDSPVDGLVVEISDAETNDSDVANTISISDGNEVGLMVVPDSSPTVRDAYWGLVCYIAPAAAGGPAGVKTLEDLAIASVKTINDTAIASVKTINDSAA